MAATATDWHWEDVKAAIRKRGITMSRLSLDLGFSNAAVRQVNFNSIPRVQAGIARFLSLKPEDIWPSRYDAAGYPISRRRSDAKHRKPSRCDAAPQKQEAIRVCE